MAASASAHAAGRVVGANDTLRVGFIGVGGRCQAHIRHVLDMTKNKQPLQAVAVCDVFNRFRDESAAKIDKANAEYGHKTKCKIFPDYRDLLADKDIDIVCICTPDHWHAKMTIDACEAGKDVYCEKPMTHSIDEAYAVVDAVKRYNRVMQVGVQSTSDPIWAHANGQIIRGRIGKVVQAQTHYYRNSTMGQWRYYELTKDMTPKNIDWDMFLGHRFGLAPRVPFDRARYFQWRCYWDYGGGMYTDLFVHRSTRLMKAMGVREPRRVVGAGGIYLEYDGRDVPDVATVVADFNEGCQLIVTATMINDHAIEECIRGHTGTIVLTGGPYDTSKGYVILDQDIKGRPTASFEGSKAKNVEVVEVPGKLRGDETPAHWTNLIECVRARNHETNNPPEIGAAAITLVNMGVISYREGRALYFDNQTRRVTNADASWALAWEQRSHRRGKPNQVIGWTAGDAGSTLTPPPYQRLEGAWIGGQDPAEGGPRPAGNAANGSASGAGNANGEPATTRGTRGILRRVFGRRGR
jgi:predicted dehydrogenase